MFSPWNTCISCPKNGISFTRTAFVSSIEVPINTSNKMGTKTTRGACYGCSWSFRPPCCTTILARWAKRMRGVSIDAEHPCCFVQCCWHIAACNCLVILNRVDLCSNTWTLPTCTFIIRPFNSHTKQCMHIELHDSTCPWIDIDVGVIWVCNRKEWIVNVLATIIKDIDHSNQITRNNRSRTSWTVSIRTHDHHVSLCNSHRWLKCWHTNTIVGSLSRVRKVSAFESYAIVTPSINSTSVVIPCQFILLKSPNRIDFFFRSFSILSKTSSKWCWQKHKHQKECKRFLHYARV